MELKEIYKYGARVHTKLFGVVHVVNDKDMFKTYKKMGLDIFKTNDERQAEKEVIKDEIEAVKVEDKRIKDFDKYQKDKKSKADKIAKDLKNAEKINKEYYKKK